MKTLVVVGHPHLDQSNINKAWVNALRDIENEDIKLHILSDVVRSDHSFDLKQEQDLIREYDRIVLQFPLYWYMVPGIMKEWMDTVWAETFAYGEGGIHMEGKLLEIAASCGAPEEAFSEISLETYLSFLKGSAAFVRAISGRIFAFYGAEMPGWEDRLKQSAAEYKEFILNVPSELATK